VRLQVLLGGLACCSELQTGYGGQVEALDLTLRYYVLISCIVHMCQGGLVFSQGIIHTQILDMYLVREGVLRGGTLNFQLF
jgi:hypothetical protein